MTDIEAFLLSLICKGVRFQINAEKLLYRAPNGTLSSTDKKLLHDQKEVCIALLKRMANSIAELPPVTNPHGQLIHDLFKEQVKSRPNAVALISGTRRITYRELDERSNQLSHYLISLGVNLEDRVGVCAERSIELVVGLLGVLKAGGVYVPIDPANPLERLAMMLEEVQVTFLLVQERWLQQLPTHRVRQILFKADLPQIAQFPVTALSYKQGPQSLAYVVYTSGSTGRPCAVGGTHAAVVNRIQAQRQIAPFKLDDVCCQKTAIGFVDSIVETLSPLLHGLPLVLISDRASRDVEELLAQLRHHGVTYLVTVPSLAHALIQAKQASESLQNVRQWIMSGEPFPAPLLHVLKKHLSLCTFVNVYGSSEVGADATYYVSSKTHSSTVPIGSPFANSLVYLLNNELQPVPIGDVGELYIGGTGLARGYVNDSGLTAERFIACPFSKHGDRMFRTGDMARQTSDGELEFVGRIDHQIKLRGHRIDITEIEMALLRSPAVQQAIVILQNGENEEGRLAAYITPAIDRLLESNELKQDIRKILPEYMIPATIHVLDKLPLNASGKLDRRSLASMRVPASSPNILVNPETSTEKILARIWIQILNIERVGITSNFFDIGGHSLLAIRITSQITEVFGTDIKLRDLFEHPTIQQLAQHIDALMSTSNRKTALPILFPHAYDGPAPLSLAQARIWHLECKHQTEATAHNLAIVVDLKDTVDIQPLELSLKALIDRHEILRTTFQKIHASTFQLVTATPNDFQLRHQDLSSIEDSTRHSQLQRLVDEEIDCPFNLQTDLLLRAVLFKFSPNHYVLAIITHKIVCDDWSLDVLTTEISAHYSTFMQGGKNTMPRPLIQYADYALWEEDRLADERLHKELEYWRRSMLSAETLRLPSIYDRPATQYLKFSTIDLNLPIELTTKLLLQANLAKITPYSLLLAAFQQKLSHWSSQTCFWIALPMSGRTHWQTRGLLGPFEKILGLRSDLTGSSTIIELAKATQLNMEEMIREQTLSFEDANVLLQNKVDKASQVELRASFRWNRADATRSAEMSGLLRIVRKPLTPFDLSLCLYEIGDTSFDGYLEYACDLFDTEIVKSWRSDLIGSLTQIAEVFPISQ